MKAFSLIELVVVLVIIAILASIATVRWTSAVDCSQDHALRRDLAVMRKAIDLYAAEHQGKFPPFNKIDLHLTGFSNLQTNKVSTTFDKTKGTIFGPYLRSIPPLPVGSKMGSAKFVNGKSVTLGSTPHGWHYDESTGVICPNLDNSELDSNGVPFNQY